MLIGLYGGTYDPIHKGHIKIAEEAVKQFNLDELWFIPAKIPPHKISTVIADENDRLNMLRLAINESEAPFKICSYELDKESISYSYITLTDFRKLYPEHEFLFIIGEDSLNDFSKWKHPEIISQMVELLVVPRYNSNYKSIIQLSEKYNKDYGTKISILNFSPIDISSTDVRRRLADGTDVSNLILKSVHEYISCHKLYLKGKQ